MNSTDLHAIADLLEQLEANDAVNADVTTLDPAGYDVELGLTLTDEEPSPTPEADQSATPVEPIPDDEGTVDEPDPDTEPAPDGYDWDGESTEEQIRTILENEGETSGTDIVRLTDKRDGSVYDALYRMDDITARKDPDDGRRKLYSIEEVEVLPGGRVEDRLRNLPDDVVDWSEDTILDRLDVSRKTLTARIPRVSEGTNDYDILDRLSSIAETVHDDVKYCGLCGAIAFSNNRLTKHHGRSHGDPDPCFLNEFPDELVVDDGNWCGYCGDGPWGDAAAVEGHHDDTHGVGSPVALRAEPSESELEEVPEASTKYSVADGGAIQEESQ